MAKKEKKNPKAGKGKKGAGRRGQGGDTQIIRLSDHPRARTGVRVWRAWGGLAGLALTAYSSWHGGAGFVDIALRGVLGGIVGFVVVWACAVQVWRHLIIAEVRAAERRWRDERDAQERLLAERASDDGDKTTVMAGGRR